VAGTGNNCSKPQVFQKRTQRMGKTGKKNNERNKEQMGPE
jgi:hypothetical protein